MKNTNLRRIMLSLIAATTLTVGQFAMMDVAMAKSAKCSAVPVPGQPGHYIVTCSRIRP